jgi:hypothetical protein
MPLAGQQLDRRASITHSFARREPAFAVRPTLARPSQLPRKDRIALPRRLSSKQQRDTTLHVGQRDTTVDLRVGFDTGGVVKVRSAPPSCLIPRHPLMPSAPSSAPLAQSNWAIKRQTNDIPAQVHLASSSPLHLDREVGPKTGRTDELTRTLSSFLSLSRVPVSASNQGQCRGRHHPLRRSVLLRTGDQQTAGQLDP